MIFRISLGFSLYFLYSENRSSASVGRRSRWKRVLYRQIFRCNRTLRDILQLNMSMIVPVQCFRFFISLISRSFFGKRFYARGMEDMNCFNMLFNDAAAAEDTTWVHFLSAEADAWLTLSFFRIKTWIYMSSRLLQEATLNQRKTSLSLVPISHMSRQWSFYYFKIFYGIKSLAL